MLPAAVPADAVVADPQLEPVVGSDQADPEVVGPGVLNDVRHGFLRNPVGDELDRVGEPVEIALDLESGSDAPIRVDLLDEGRQGGLQAEVVEGGGAEAPRQVEQFPHRLGGQRARLLELGGDLGIVGGTAQRLEPEEQSGERLVDLVVQVAGDPGPLLLLGAQGRVRSAAALGLQPLQHLVERALEADHLLRPLCLHREVGRRGPAQVRLLHLRDQALQRLEALGQQPDVDADRERQCEAEDEADRGAVAQRVVGVRGDRRCDNGCRDQQQVDHQNLGEKRSSAHAPDESTGARKSLSSAPT